MDNNPYKTPVGRRMSRKQSDAEVPQMRMVSVAVLPPRLPGGMAPPTGAAISGAIAFDDAINYSHNEPANEKEVSKTKQWMRKAGITTQRQKANPDTPPFIFRQIPYDTWRKHYAKDSDGNYRGTHAPAEDCLLKPDDVKKWNIDGEPKTKADRWTRGSEALPVYSEALEQGQAPEYRINYDHVPDGEPTLDTKSGSNTPPHRQQSEGSVQGPAQGHRPSRTIADGKTAEQIIAEAKAKQPPKTSWMNKLKKGAETAIMGS